MRFMTLPQGVTQTHVFILYGLQCPIDIGASFPHLHARVLLQSPVSGSSTTDPAFHLALFSVFPRRILKSQREHLVTPNLPSMRTSLG